MYHSSTASHHWFDSNDIDIRREEILQTNINSWSIPRKSKTDTTRTVISTFSMTSNRVNWRWWNSIKQSICDDKLDTWKRSIRLSMSRIIFVFTTEDVVHMQCDFGTFWRWFCRKRVCISNKLMSKQNNVFSRSEFVSDLTWNVVIFMGKTYGQSCWLQSFRKIVTMLSESIGMKSSVSMSRFSVLIEYG